MPQAPRRPCAQPGCPALVGRGERYCQAHQAAQRRAYDDKRGSAASRGYGARWRRYRLMCLRRHPLCQAPGCTRPAECVDHIVPVSGADDPGFWIVSNHQGLCLRCHSAKTAAEDGGFGNP